MENSRIIGFEEKKFTKLGYINGGIYLIKADIFQRVSLGEYFSFEKDLLENHLNDFDIYGHIENRFFIDIGIPEDYERAKIDLPKFYEQSRIS